MAVALSVTQQATDYGYQQPGLFVSHKGTVMP